MPEGLPKITMGYVFYEFKILDIYGPVQPQFVTEQRFFLRPCFRRQKKVSGITGKVDNNEDNNGDSKNDNKGLEKSLYNIALHR